MVDGAGGDVEDDEQMDHLQPDGAGVKEIVAEIADHRRCWDAAGAGVAASTCCVGEQNPLETFPVVAGHDEVR